MVVNENTFRKLYFLQIRLFKLASVETLHTIKFYCHFVLVEKKRNSGCYVCSWDVAWCMPPVLQFHYQQWLCPKSLILQKHKW